MCHYFCSFNIFQRRNRFFSYFFSRSNYSNIVTVYKAPIRIQIKTKSGTKLGQISESGCKYNVFGSTTLVCLLAAELTCTWLSHFFFFFVNPELKLSTISFFLSCLTILNAHAKENQVRLSTEHCEQCHNNTVQPNLEGADASFVKLNLTVNCRTVPWLRDARPAGWVTAVLRSRSRHF